MVSEVHPLVTDGPAEALVISDRKHVAAVTLDEQGLPASFTINHAWRDMVDAPTLAALLTAELDHAVQFATGLDVAVPDPQFNSFSAALRALNESLAVGAKAPEDQQWVADTDHRAELLWAGGTFVAARFQPGVENRTALQLTAALNEIASSRPGKR